MGEQRYRKAAGLTVDCSQRGNGEFWRNVILDGRKFDLKCNGSVIPERGFLTMDCATMLRPASDAEEISEERFDQLMADTMVELQKCRQAEYEAFITWLRWASTQADDLFISGAQMAKMILAMPSEGDLRV